MALYIVRPDVPAPGVDWEISVPGQYLYNVMGVYATLNTFAPSPLEIPDASGNGNDGNYFQYYAPDGPYFVPGLVTGNEAVDAAHGGGSGMVQVQGPVVFDWTTSWCMTWWDQSPIAGGSGTLFKYVGITSGTGPTAQIWVQVGAGLDYLILIGTPDWRTAPGTVPNDGLPHFYGVQWDKNTGIASFFLDGALVPWMTTGAAPSGVTPAVGFFELGNGAGLAAEITDELAMFRSAFLPAFFADLASKQGNFAAYNAAILGANPELYYHFAQPPPADGRQVVLNITDGTNRVELIPSGFAKVADTGPYVYSWLPKLATATQSPDGRTTTIPLPRLVLPAGYTVGVVTLDGEPADEWSEIAVWWNSNIMDSLVPITPYAYPPGATLVYQQVRRSE